MAALFIRPCLPLKGDDDRHNILTKMMPVADSWKAIGTGLGIASGRLNTIQDSNSGKPRERLLEVLTCWLNRNYNVERFGEPTWRAVVKVVAHPAGGDNHALALNIAKQHPGNSWLLYLKYACCCYSNISFISHVYA